LAYLQVFQKDMMVLRSVSAAFLGAVLLVASGASNAAEYRPDDYLNLDPSTALLSPTPLGPPAAFVPVPVEAKEAKDDHANSAQASAEPVREVKVKMRKTRVANVHQTPAANPHRTAVASEANARREKPRIAEPRTAEKQLGAARTRLARRHHGNPLDAQAFDTRIQTWPCRTGGICNWK
jgi:hypothetical protein